MVEITNNMISAVLELGIGYFVTYKLPYILELNGNLSKVVKVVGVLMLILGFINLVECLAKLIL